MNSNNCQKQFVSMNILNVFLCLSFLIFFGGFILWFIPPTYFKISHGHFIGTLRTIAMFQKLNFLCVLKARFLIYIVEVILRSKKYWIVVCMTKSKLTSVISKYK